MPPDLKFEDIINGILSFSKSLNSITNLNSIDVERRGQAVNLLYLLRERSCLAVLDDLQLGLSIADLKKYCGDRSAILVTRQSANDGDLRMPLFEFDDASKILEHGLSSRCPEDIFKIVWDTIGGHPLALRLMNAGVRNGSWNDLRYDCAAIGEYSDTDRLYRLADRLLGRLKNLIERELSFFSWCDSARVDRSFARRAIFPVGFRKLDESCLLAADRNDVIRLHDIVYAAIPTLHLAVDTYSDSFNAALDAFIDDIAFGTPTALSFINFRHIHSDKIKTLLASNPERSTCLYCLTQAWSDQEVDLSLVGDPIARANKVAASCVPTDIDVSAICEAIEAI
jgi:hypothetical protein